MSIYVAFSFMNYIDMCIQLILHKYNHKSSICGSSFLHKLLCRVIKMKESNLSRAVFVMLSLQISKI